MTTGNNEQNGNNGNNGNNEQNKLLVRRLVDEAVNQSNLDVLAELADGEFAQTARLGLDSLKK